MTMFLGEWLNEATLGSARSPLPPQIELLTEAKSTIEASKETLCCIPGDRDSPVDTASPVPAVFINYGLSFLNFDAHYDPLEQGEGGVYGEPWDVMLQRFRTGLDSVLPERAPSTSSTSGASSTTKGMTCLGYGERKAR